MSRRIRDGAETGSRAVSSAAVRHSPSDLQPKTALSLLERWTIPRVEEGPGGWVGRVCVYVCVCRGGRGGRGGKDGGCFGALCRRSTEAVRMETPVRAGGLSRPETARTPKPGCVFDNDRSRLVGRVCRARCCLGVHGACCLCLCVGR